jgi:taurine dioxygenase
MALHVRKLAYALGAEVSGLDLSNPVDESTMSKVRALWLEHLVLVFPDQDITMEQHIEFSSGLGELEVHPQKHFRHPVYPPILEVTNRVVDGKKSDTAEVGRLWHSDGAYTTRPATGSLLHCRELPAVGGDTWFTNMYTAYDRLSPAMKAIVEQLEVVNDLTARIDMTGRDPQRVADHLRDNPPVVQPMVRTHPETGRKALYLNETVTRQIYGMTREESDGLLQFLFKHSVRPEFTFRHRWSKHDLVIWDNRCSMHLAPADYDSTQLRHMCRTTLLGEPLGFLESARNSALVTPTAERTH